MDPAKHGSALPSSDAANLGRLPFDILFQIFGHIDTRTLTALLGLSKTLNTAANTFLWKHVDPGSATQDREIKAHLQRHPRLLHFIRSYVSHSISAFPWLLPRLSIAGEVQLKWDSTTERGNPLYRCMTFLASSKSTMCIAQLDLVVCTLQDESLVRRIQLFTGLRILRIRPPPDLPEHRLGLGIPPSQRCRLTATGLVDLVQSPTLEHLIVDKLNSQSLAISRKRLPGLRSIDVQLAVRSADLTTTLSIMMHELKQQNLFFRFRVGENVYDSLVRRGYGTYHSHQWLQNRKLDPTFILRSLFDSMLYMNRTFNRHDSIAVVRTFPWSGELDRIKDWINTVSTHPTTFSVHISCHYQFDIIPKSSNYFIFKASGDIAESVLEYFVSQMSTLRRLSVAAYEHGPECYEPDPGHWTFKSPSSMTTKRECWKWDRTNARERQERDFKLPLFMNKRLLWYESCKSLEYVTLTLHC